MACWCYNLRCLVKGFEKGSRLPQSAPRPQVNNINSYKPTKLNCWIMSKKPNKTTHFSIQQQTDSKAEAIFALLGTRRSEVLGLQGLRRTIEREKGLRMLQAGVGYVGVWFGDELGGFGVFFQIIFGWFGQWWKRWDYFEGMLGYLGVFWPKDSFGGYWYCKCLIHSGARGGFAEIFGWSEQITPSRC